MHYNVRHSCSTTCQTSATSAAVKATYSPFSCRSRGSHTIFSSFSYHHSWFGGHFTSQTAWWTGIIVHRIKRTRLNGPSFVPFFIDGPGFRLWTIHWRIRNFRNSLIFMGQELHRYTRSILSLHWSRTFPQALFPRPLSPCTTSQAESDLSRSTAKLGKNSETKDHQVLIY